MGQDTEENILLSPKEVRERRERPIPETIPEENHEYVNRGETVAINFESNGRFSLPPVLNFSGYNVENITDITMSKPEDIFETLVTILNKLKTDETECDIGNATLEELLEIMVGLKLKFDTKLHEHTWVCECQYGLGENEIKPHTTVIDLSTLTYKSIKDADKVLQDKVKKFFDNISEDDFGVYLKNRYGNAIPDEWSKEKEVSTIQVREPFHYIDPETNKKYSFRLMKLCDLIEAQKIAKKKYGVKISQVQKRVHVHGTPLAEFKQSQADDIEKLKEERGKEAILLARGMSLVKVDDVDIHDFEERANIFKKLKTSVLFDLSEFQDDIQFGVVTQHDFECPLCGKTDRRLLQPELNPIELLPIDSNAKRKHRDNTKLNVFVGV